MIYDVIVIGGSYAGIAAALQVAENAEDGARILAMIPDTGERYLSTPLFDDIAEEMTAEELEIGASVPPLRRAPRPTPTKRDEEQSPEAVAYVDAAIRSKQEPVVMFGFEWCEFCWSVRKLFNKTRIAFRTVDVDSADLRDGDRGGKILRALFDRTGQRTVPQVFVGGELVGGATDVLTAFNDGSLQDSLSRIGITVGNHDVEDALSFLPGWVRRKPEPNGTRSTRRNA